MKKIFGVTIALTGLMLMGSDSDNMSIFILTKIIGLPMFFLPLYLSGAMDVNKEKIHSIIRGIVVQTLKCKTVWKQLKKSKNPGGAMMG